QANQASSELGHEVDGFGRDLFGGEGEVAFVLAILVVDHHDHAARTDFLDRIGNVGEWVLGTHIVAILAESITAEQKPLTAEIAKAARRTKRTEENEEKEETKNEERRTKKRSPVRAAP